MATTIDEARLSETFSALASSTRRGILARLAEGEATVNELAEPFDMALPSFMKHIRFLEASGWIRTRKEGRVRTCTIEGKPLAAATAWLADQRALWEGRTDRLEQFVTTNRKGKA